MPAPAALGWISSGEGDCGTRGSSRRTRGAEVSGRPSGLGGPWTPTLQTPVPMEARCAPQAGSLPLADLRTTVSKTEEPSFFPGGKAIVFPANNTAVELAAHVQRNPSAPLLRACGCSRDLGEVPAEGTPVRITRQTRFGTHLVRCSSLPSPRFSKPEETKHRLRQRHKAKRLSVLFLTFQLSPPAG